MSTSNGSKKWRKALIGVAVVTALGAAGLVLAHPGAGFGPLGYGPGGFGPGFMRGMGSGMGPPMMRGSFAGPMAAQQLMSPEEQQAFMEKMQNAKTPEERQKLAEANRTEMEERAKEKGITFPAAQGPFGGMGPGMMHGMGPGAAGAFRGPMFGPMAAGAQHDDAFPADMQLVHHMLQSHDKIRRTVTNLPDGIRTVTESDDPQVAQLIKAHVGSMEKRLEEGRIFNLFSPTLPVLFEHKDNIRTSVETTETGVVVSQTSSNTKVVAALQAHAVEVSELARDGMVAMMRAARANAMGRSAQR